MDLISKPAHNTALEFCCETRRFRSQRPQVGGGLATIPFLMDIADKYPWLTREMLADMIAVSESTPGPIGVNMATYAGFEAAGVAGALTATFSLVLPSFQVILLIARFLQKYNSSPLVQSTFSCIRPAVAGLIGAAGWSVIRVALFTGAAAGIGGLLSSIDWRWAGLFAALLVLSNIKPLKKLHPIVFIGVAAVVGIVVGLL